MTFVCTHRAVKWTLLSRISSRWPSKRFGGELVMLFQDCVFLLKTEPWLFLESSIKNFLGKMSEVSVGGN